MVLSLIACIGINNELGKDNQLIWKIPSDLAHFKKTTLNKIIVMGRKTLESIGHPLPQRRNIILTRTLNPNIKGCYQTSDIKDILNLKKDIYVCGGEQTYSLFMPYCEELIITHVNEEFPEADSFFPTIDYGKWEETEVIENNYDTKPYYTIIRYHRKQVANCI